MLVCDYQLIPNYPTYPHSHLLQPSLTPNSPREKQICLFGDFYRNYYYNTSNQKSDPFARSSKGRLSKERRRSLPP